MNESETTSRTIAERSHEIKTQLESVRRLLIETPGKFSVESAGVALGEVTHGLIALDDSLRRAAGGNPYAGELTSESTVAISEVLALSGRVNALYRQASSFYGSLAQATQGAVYDGRGEATANSLTPQPSLKVNG